LPQLFCVDYTDAEIAHFMYVTYLQRLLTGCMTAGVFIEKEQQRAALEVFEGRGREEEAFFFSSCCPQSGQLPQDSLLEYFRFLLFDIFFAPMPMPIRHYFTATPHYRPLFARCQLDERQAFRAMPLFRIRWRHASSTVDIPVVAPQRNLRSVQIRQPFSP